VGFLTYLHCSSLINLLSCSGKPFGLRSMRSSIPKILFRSLSFHLLKSISGAGCDTCLLIRFVNLFLLMAAIISKYNEHRSRVRCSQFIGGCIVLALVRCALAIGVKLWRFLLLRLFAVQQLPYLVNFFCSHNSE